ncbi:MAG: hypothetical protein LBD14_07100 [Puniceicoccales bacterium]|jgi:hypothetical protein|nr:hypothetical protein [Puniceicoccales bacterium]
MPDAHNSQEKSLDLSQLQSLNIGPAWATSNTPRPPSTSTPAHRPEHSGHDHERSRRPQRHRDDTAAPEPRRPFPRQHTPANAPHPAHFPQRQPRPRPVADITFAPEEKPFTVLAKAIKASMRTYELFEIAHLILEKNDRFTVTCHPHDAGRNPDAHLYQSLPDQLPFLSENDAIAHVLQRHLATFFDIQTITVPPPKGNYTLLTRCGITGTPLSPPNYHGYQQILREHHATHLPHIPYERFAARIETTREPGQIDAWLQRMTQITRYTPKNPKDGDPAHFDSLESARHHLITHHKDQIVAPGTSIRFPGRQIEKLPNGPLRTTIENELQYQRTFPLATATALRPRLRRQGFTIYKRGAKGHTYVTAIQRKHRTPQTNFADSIQRTLDYIEKHPNVKITDLPEKILGLGTPSTPPAQPAVETTAAPPQENQPADATSENKNESPTQPDATAAPETQHAPQPPATTPANDLKNPLVLELMQTLRWLVSEGYVTEYSDGRLYAHPILNQSKTADNNATPETTKKKKHTRPAPTTAEAITEVTTPSPMDEKPLTAANTTPVPSSHENTSSADPLPPAEAPSPPIST